MLQSSGLEGALRAPHLEQQRVLHGPYNDLMHQLLGILQPGDVFPAGAAAAVQDLVAHLQVCEPEPPTGCVGPSDWKTALPPTCAAHRGNPLALCCTNLLIH